MTYTVLARRYRSRDFDEIVGQAPIARTLKNAVDSGRVAHAYLFCGTRGVGKTSMARILARALNATDDLAQREQVAEAILRGEDLDVVEIDGASNRGINEARDLIANAGLSPARSPYKIYIIDEVHQITRDAFNALLKTMEEPPAHVKFILCTTEPNKVPATIQSRCQRFDFRPLSTTQIADQLRKILANENIKADEDAILQIARLGNGSMRDALSILDRVLSAGEDTITSKLIEDMLGLPDRALIVNVVDAIIQGDPNAVLERGGELLSRGMGVEQALELLTEYFRALMIVTACGDDSDLLALSSEEKQTAARQAEHFDTAGLVHMIALCDSIARSASGSTTARALYDAALVRLAMTERFADITKLLADGSTGAPRKKTASSASGSSTGGKKKESQAVSEARPPARDRLTQSTPAPAPPAAAPSTPSPSTHVTELKASPTEPSTENIWQQVIGNTTSRADLAKIEPLEFKSEDGNTLRLGINEHGAGIVRYLKTQTEAIANIVQRATGRTMRIIIDADDTAAAPRGATQSERLDEVRKLPVVEAAMDIFDATIIAVQENSHTTQTEVGTRS